MRHGQEYQLASPLLCRCLLQIGAQFAANSPAELTLPIGQSPSLTTVQARPASSRTCTDQAPSLIAPASACRPSSHGSSRSPPRCIGRCAPSAPLLPPLSSRAASPAIVVGFAAAGDECPSPTLTPSPAWQARLADRALQLLLLLAPQLHPALEARWADIVPKLLAYLKGCVVDGGATAAAAKLSEWSQLCLHFVGDSLDAIAAFDGGPGWLHLAEKETLAQARPCHCEPCPPTRAQPRLPAAVSPSNARRAARSWRSRAWSHRSWRRS